MAIFFAQNLRYFRANFFFANFCAIFAHETQWVLRGFAQFFCAICAKPEIFFANFCAWNENSFAQIFLRNLRKTGRITQNVTFQQIDKNWNFKHRIKQLRIYSTITYKKIINKKNLLKLLSIGYFLLQSSNYSKRNWDLRDWETWQYLNPIKLISSDPPRKDDNSQRYP